MKPEEAKFIQIQKGMGNDKDVSGGFEIQMNGVPERGERTRPISVAPAGAWIAFVFWSHGFTVGYFLSRLRR